MNILNALFQGIIQGLTEFLPVSSSGHLSLIQYFTGQGGETGALFSILLHLGTLIAVFLAFHKTILRLIYEFFCMVGDIFKGKFQLSHLTPYRRMIVLLIISLLPLAVTFVFKDWLQGFSSDNSILAEGICFLITGVLLTLADRFPKGRKTPKTMTYGDALAIGAAQAIAPLPGISRSGSTIATGLMMGLDRQYAVTFSFIMGMPAVLGGAILEIKDAAEAGVSLPFSVMAVGMLSAAVFGLIAIKMVNWLVKSDKFKIFAYYTLALGTLVTAAGIYEMFTDHALQKIVLTWFQ